mmetsp:Transcript_15136/g.20888  ORF Transcript_15136/g.20888 Transcript_15136/m.20888 type:complete len:362 (-) Transcript_15136:192-1277(-)|eukprot:CAMPEP_0196581886 /NCGR_PEP_ID=MMETSP1081-20130531/36230_1 /TAXON_ID=36882 /ORGANISM="Pyramimonas amylifera, Strain CCMP720" /LENGTH=361 /DNA_ID=CAMNT_0041902279 /DNA_START=171 /DNA_END=1256 /DNA_ORIENTATION=-
MSGLLRGDKDELPLHSVPGSDWNVRKTGMLPRAKEGFKDKPIKAGSSRTTALAAVVGFLLVSSLVYYYFEEEEQHAQPTLGSGADAEEESEIVSKLQNVAGEPKGGDPLLLSTHLDTSMDMNDILKQTNAAAEENAAKAGDVGGTEDTKTAEPHSAPVLSQQNLAKNSQEAAAAIQQVQIAENFSDAAAGKGGSSADGKTKKALAEENARLFQEMEKMRQEFHTMQQQLSSAEAEKLRHAELMQQIEAEKSVYMKNLTRANESRNATKIALAKYKIKAEEKRLQRDAFHHKLKEMGVDIQSAGKLIKEQVSQGTGVGAPPALSPPMSATPVESKPKPAPNSKPSAKKALVERLLNQKILVP